jgi:PIN domain nuclease of toxin-antitoxin system
VTLLLDTHILLWLMEDDPQLTASAHSLIVNASEVYVSSASIWEIAIKWRLGKIQENPEVIAEQLLAAGLKELLVSNRHAVATGRLPLLHRDPFDRLLVAQAISETMRLLTSDAQLAAYSELVTVI